MQAERCSCGKDRRHGEYDIIINIYIYYAPDIYRARPDVRAFRFHGRQSMIIYRKQ